MNISNIALSVEQMEELIELGVDITSASCIWEYKGSNGEEDFYNLEILDYDDSLIAEKDIPAFTLQNILEMLPEKIGILTNELVITHKQMAYKGTGVGGYNCIHCEYEHGNLLETAFAMLKWCKQNKHI